MPDIPAHEEELVAEDSDPVPSPRETEEDFEPTIVRGRE